MTYALDHYELIATVLAFWTLCGIASAGLGYLVDEWNNR